MMAIITRSVVNGLPVSPPSGTKQFAWDIQLPGFGAYKVTSGRVSFIYQYRMGRGRTRSIFIGTLGEMTIEQARTRAMTFAQQRRDGTDPKEAIREAADKERAAAEMVLSVYAANFLQRRIDGGNPLNKAQTAIVNRDIVALLGHHRLDELKTHHIEDFAATLGKRAVSARRMGIVYLKTILNDAKRRGVIQISPADAIETPKSGERDRVLREDEIQRFYEAAGDMSEAGDLRGDLYEAILRLLKRKEEVSQIQWESIDVKAATWRLEAEQTKNRKAAVVHLPPQVVAIFERQQPDPMLRRGPVFTLNGGQTHPEMGSQVKDILDANLHRRLEVANERDGTALAVSHFTIHDLRTTGASKMQEEPLAIRVDVINAVLLHVVGSGVTKIYLRAGLAREAGDALRAWNDWLDDLMRRDDAWPGGRGLPKLKGAEVKRRIGLLRQGWPKRIDQVRAIEKKAKEGKIGS